MGGSTVVSYTTSFRTPEPTLAHWRDQLGLRHITSPALQDSFAHVEERLHITDWTVPLNPSNRLLEQGLKTAGFHSHRIQRNVKGCLSGGRRDRWVPIGVLKGSQPRQS